MGHGTAESIPKGLDLEVDGPGNGLSAWVENTQSWMGCLPEYYQMINLPGGITVGVWD